ncbi:FUSC family protein [Bordetella sp. BOR01]|uniref:FUSC family protein n=1 Tax=Bordetella sp. BOR01 TaxID=2854779 RepID=UPI001C455EE0|nr:FUSC family protein [Bordetella sp. BOR01]MBV7485861.1 FUSC family protein [Bordetella sp. BOR01]
MKLPNADELLFSVKCYVGAITALYLSYTMGLSRPFWAMTTAYVVSQPWAGAVRSKAVFRLGGTFFGSAVMVYLVPRLSNAPVLMILAMVLWVGLCLYIAVLDRTPRSYLFMLAGYTAAMIGFPSVTDPGTVFDTALARVEEISLGIVCATLAHSLVLPRGIAKPLMARLDATVRDARNWIRETLTQRDDARRGKERRVLAEDITLLRMLSTHVPFDTGNIRWTAGAVRAMQDQIAALTPLVSAVDDRLQALQDGGRELPGPVAEALNDIAAWIDAGPQAERAQAATLRAALSRLAPEIGPAASWRDALLASLVVRLRELVDAYDRCLALRHDIRAGLAGTPRHGARPVRLAAGAILHRDRGLALLSALAAALAISVCCVFWIGAAWTNGATAAMMAAIFSCFFAAQDNPVPGIMQFLVYTIYSIPLSALYLLGIMPAIHSFEMLALSILPVALVLGALIPRPAYTLRAMALLFGFLGTLALHDTHTADLVSFVDTMVAQIIGVATAALIAAIFRTISADQSARRIQAANWKELAALASASRAPSRSAYTLRMLDRIGLLQPRLAMAKRSDDQLAADALKDLRVGNDIAELQRARRVLPAAESAIRPVLGGLAGFFRQRSAAGHNATDFPVLLADIDRALARVTATPGALAARDRAVVALVGIRRALFPQAPDYQSDILPAHAS